MSKNTNVWMPLYVADYLADTMRLTTEQHGAYMLLIMDYWRNGPPPDDEAVLCSITRLSELQWRKHAFALQAFFDVSDGAWNHKRIDAERTKATGINGKRVSSGVIGAANKWGTSTSKTSSKTPGKTSGKTCEETSGKTCEETSGKTCEETSDKTSSQIRAERLAEARRKGTHTADEWAALVDVLGNVCVACNVHADNLEGAQLCKDHIVPIYQGGDDSLMNLQPMCKNCNSRKGANSEDLRGSVKQDWLSDLEKRLAKRLAKRVENVWQTSRQSQSQSQLQIVNQNKVGFNPPLTPPSDAASEGDLPQTALPHTPAGEVCKAMKSTGLQAVNPSNQTLATLIEAGASVLEFKSAAADAVKRGKGFSYALQIVVNERKRAAELAGQVLHGALPSKSEALRSRNQTAMSQWLAEQGENHATV